MFDTWLFRNEELQALKRYKAELVFKSTQQREEMIVLIQRAHQQSVWLDRGFALAQSMKKHPKIAALMVGGGLLVIGKCFPSLRYWLTRGFALYQWGRSMGKFFPKSLE